MFGRKTVPQLCAAVADAVDRLDMPAAQKAMAGLERRVARAPQADLDAGLAHVAPALRRVKFGNGPLLVILTAGLIEAGADPLPVLDLLVERVTAGLEDAARFLALADHMDGGMPAEPTSSEEAHALLARAEAAARAAGMDEEDAANSVMAWMMVNDWIPGLLLPLQQKRARQALTGRERLIAAASAMQEHAEDAVWLLGLLQVLDDEPLIVIDRATGAACEVTISDIGDNFQLHTLLAATLIPGFVAGERPAQAWIDAATTGPMEPPSAIMGQFNLVAADGSWIWNEGRPADIPFAGERRVVVLDPPAYQRTWNVGRVYPLMPPEIHLTRVLPPEEAATWPARVKPSAG